MQKTTAEKISSLWSEELEKTFDAIFEWEIHSAASCANLPEDLSDFSTEAEEDPDFKDDLEDWVNYVWEKGLWLALEQACDEAGVLLPYPNRGDRLKTCPEEWGHHLHFVFSECSDYVQAHLALYFFTLVRIERARRTGNPHWSPETAVPNPEEHAFFTPPKLKFRNYAR